AFRDGVDLVDLETGAFEITFKRFDSDDAPLDLSGFGLDDRIKVDVASLSGISVFDQVLGQTDTYTDFGTTDDTAWSRELDVRNGPSSSQTRADLTLEFYVSEDDTEATFRYEFSTRIMASSSTTESTSRSADLGVSVGFDTGLTDEQFFNRVSFVAPEQSAESVWVALRADAAIAPQGLATQVHGVGGTMLANVAAELSLDLVNEAPSVRSSFLDWWNLSFNEDYSPSTDAEWESFASDVQSYFNEFVAEGVHSRSIPVKFVRVDVDWDGYGDMAWSLSGVAAAAVVAPQDSGSPFASLDVVKSLVLAEGDSVGDASVQMGAQAVFEATGADLQVLAALQPSEMLPTFTVVSDEVTDGLIRTVVYEVARADTSSQDVISYQANLPS
ncbi:MAG: hypothetical protein ACPGUF_08090, partial [Litorivicinus sp.]